ncbi:MAG: dTDP-4-dehydrorhamnose 3,5-epimerase [Cyanobacteria bacterium P01_D01_bin.156]
MGQIGQVTIHSLPLKKSDRFQLCELPQSDNTVLLKIGAGVVGDLGVHQFQTNRILAVTGGLVVVTLQNKKYDYIFLETQNSNALTISSGIPYGFINLGSTPCWAINDAVYHGPEHKMSLHESGYRSLKPPFPYDIAQVIQLWQDNGEKEHHYPMLRAV